MAKRSAPTLLIAVGFLLGLGVVMLISTCAFSATSPADDIYQDAKRQAVWLLLGGLCCAGAACIDYHWMQKRAWWIFGITAFLLLLCYIPGIGTEVNGERRWISAKLVGLSALRMQPSEMAKLTMAIMLGWWFAMYPDSGRHPLRGFLYPLSLAGLLIVLVLFEKDMGTAAVLSATCFTLLFVVGVRIRYLTGLAVSGTAALALLVKYDPNRFARIMAYLDIEGNKLGFAFQQWIGLMALGSGGVSGRGLGEGRLKMLYMPFAHTDFIFPMIGEELGLAFTLLVVFAFVLLAVAGITISFHAPDAFGRVLGLGMVCFISFQAALNIGVTTAVLPNTGLPLPFVSYGGTALLTAMTAVGILLNIYRQGRETVAENRYWVNGKRITPRL
ncbi:MAG: cell division protein FtsW [Verrucomicrobiae bacterium]|nr:cell division protein FtsW [Verrucomicrobiae bacterium]